MKTSNLLIASLVAFLAFANLSFNNAPAEDSFIEVYFSNKQDIKDLAQIQSDLLKKDIKLNYDYLKFNKDGKLQEIGYNVKTNKVGGSDETDDTNTEIGFIINTDPNPKAKYGIIVGTKEQVQTIHKNYEGQK